MRISSVAAASKTMQNGELRYRARGKRVDQVGPVRSAPAGAEVVPRHCRIRPVVPACDVVKTRGVIRALANGVNGWIKDSNWGCSVASPPLVDQCCKPCSERRPATRSTFHDPVAIIID